MLKGNPNCICEEVPERSRDFIFRDRIYGESFPGNIWTFAKYILLGNNVENYFQKEGEMLICFLFCGGTYEQSPSPNTLLHCRPHLKSSVIRCLVYYAKQTLQGPLIQNISRPCFPMALFTSLIISFESFPLMMFFCYCLLCGGLLSCQSANVICTIANKQTVHLSIRMYHQRPCR